MANKEEKKEEMHFKIINIGESVPTPTMDSRYSQWIKWGDDDRFPDYLIDVYKLKSITQKAIINRKAEMISRGFMDTTNPVLTSLYDNENSSDKLKKILHKCALDYYVVGAFALELIYSTNGRKIVQVEHVPIETIRKDREWGVGEIDYFHVCKDFSKRFKFPVNKIPAYNKKNRDPKQILYVTKHEPGIKYDYPVVNWYSVVNYVLAEWEISQCHIKNIQNGFSAGMFINFLTGDVSDEEKRTAYNQFKDKFTGSYNSGVIILNWANSQEQKATIDPIPSNTGDTKWIDLTSLIEKKIMVQNGITNPELFAILQEGGIKFGTLGELEEKVKIFQSLVIDFDKEVFEDAFNIIASFNGSSEEVKIKNFQVTMAESEKQVGEQIAPEITQA